MINWKSASFFNTSLPILKPDLKLTKISHYDSENCEPQELLEVLLPEDSDPHLEKTYFYRSNHKSSAIEKLRSQNGLTLKTYRPNVCTVKNRSRLQK